MSQIPGYQTYHFARLKKHKHAKRDSGGILILVFNKIHKLMSVQRESDIKHLNAKCSSLESFDFTLFFNWLKSHDILGFVETMKAIPSCTKFQGTKLTISRLKNP